MKFVPITIFGMVLVGSSVVVWAADGEEKRLDEAATVVEVVPDQAGQPELEEGQEVTVEFSPSVDESVMESQTGVEAEDVAAPIQVDEKAVEVEEAVAASDTAETDEWEDASESEQNPEYEYIYIYEDEAGVEIPDPAVVVEQPVPSEKPEGFFPLGREVYKSPLIWLPVLALSWLVLMRLGRRKSVDLGDDGFSMHLSHKGRKQLEEKQCDSGGYQGPKAF